jgi:hypothetical protein
MGWAQWSIGICWVKIHFCLLSQTSDGQKIMHCQETSQTLLLVPVWEWLLKRRQAFLIFRTQVAKEMIQNLTCGNQKFILAMSITFNQAIFGRDTNYNSFEHVNN